MAQTTRLRVHQDGNRVTVEGGPTRIDYEVQGLELPVLDNLAFCVWHFLSPALLTGSPIEVDGPVDSGTLAAAERFSRTWELWDPRRFREVRISARSRPSAPAPARRKDPLVLFSGGVDSTHMLLQLGRQATRGVALTAHGYDYNAGEAEHFDRLRAKVKPLLDKLNYDQVVVRTNAKVIAHGVQSYALRLAGAAALFSGLFERALFAADFSTEQDMLAVPWGLNHVTNRYFRTDDFVMEPRCEDVTRAEKVALLARDDTALAALSFCPDRAVAPRNCGRCKKCIRTKVMFMAETGALPPIFEDMSFHLGYVRTLFAAGRKEEAFFIDLYQRARAAGTLARVPGLAEQFAKRYGETKRQQAVRSFSKTAGELRGRVPAPVRRAVRRALGLSRR